MNKKYRVVENTRGDKSKFYTIEVYQFDDIWIKATELIYNNLEEAKKVAKTFFDYSLQNSKVVAVYE